MLFSDLKNKIKKNKFTIGTWITISSSLIPELYSKSGLDWICVDLEHTSINLHQLENIIISAHNNNLPVLVRVGDHNKNEIKKIMDIGAAGIIAADVKNKNEINNLVHAVKYPKIGLRGLGLYRAQEFGDKLKQYINWNNKDSIIIPQIESKEAVDNISDILENKNIDALMIGPYDLSASLGVAGDFNSKIYKKYLSIINKKAKLKKIPVGIHVIYPDSKEAIKFINQGFSFIVFSLDSLILKSTMDKNIYDIKKKFKIHMNKK